MNMKMINTSPIRAHGEVMSGDAALPRREVERVVTDCPKCAGNGWIFEGAWKECAACYGTGLPPRTVDIYIREAFRKHKKKEPRS